MVVVIIIFVLYQEKPFLRMVKNLIRDSVQKKKRKLFVVVTDLLLI